MQRPAHAGQQRKDQDMKMAKASEADLNMAIEVCNALEALAGHWGAFMPEKINNATVECDNEPFDIDDHAQCIRVIEYLQQLARSASLMRVVFGMTVLLDPDNKMVDPDADTLDHHPDTVAALAAMAAAPAVGAA
jgi:hypothetical protein